jgi:hypothetical protein
VVLHVLADAARFVHDGYADLRQMLGIADTRQLQERKRCLASRGHLTRRDLRANWQGSARRTRREGFGG